MRADGRAGRDATVVPDVGRPLDLLEIGDVDTLAEPDVPADADTGNVQPDVLLERVEVRLTELVEVADVLPVAVHHVPVQRPAHLEQVGEELLREVVGSIGRNVPQHFGLQHVDPRVDRVGEDLAPGGLLEKAFDPPLFVGDDDPELERIVHRLQADRDRRAAFPVEGDERAQVDVAERVARDDEERLVELLRREPNRTGRAERRLLDRVADLHPERLSLSEVAADRLRQKRNSHDHVVQPVLAQQLEDVLHARLSDDRDHRLRLVGGQRAQARALAAGHYDGLHRLTPFQAAAAYTRPAATARTRPVTKIQ